VGEGHRKVWAAARGRGPHGEDPNPAFHEGGRAAGAVAIGRGPGTLQQRGTILTRRPDEDWGTDATSTWTAREGHVTVLVAVEHRSSEGVGIHAAKIGSRLEALGPIRQLPLWELRPCVPDGLGLRHDHDSQCTSDDFQRAAAFIGMESSPTFVCAPGGNGCAERFIRTLKEQLLWVRTFGSREQVWLPLHAWLKVYNERWLIGRHGHRSPAEVRRELLASSVAA
jgi:putative transposase